MICPLGKGSSRRWPCIFLVHSITFSLTQVVRMTWPHMSKEPLLPFWRGQCFKRQLWWKCKLMCDSEPCWLFLQRKTRNFAHPTLKHLIVNFFHMGMYCIAQQCADIFCHYIPFQCLTLASTAVILKHFTVLCMLTTIQFNCVLDGFVKDSRGKHMTLFLGKNYGSI